MPQLLWKKVKLIPSKAVLRNGQNRLPGGPTIPLLLHSPIKVPRIQFRCEYLLNFPLPPRPVIGIFLFATNTQNSLIVVIQITACISKDYFEENNSLTYVLFMYKVGLQ